MVSADLARVFAQMCCNLVTAALHASNQIGPVVQAI